MSVQNLLHILEIFEFGKMSPETCAAHRQLGMKMENVITLSFIDHFSKFKKILSFFIN